MAPEQKQDSKTQSGPDTPFPEPPSIHPSFIQIAKPYIFEQTIQKCIAAMEVNPLREESMRLQGVTWIDNVRRALNLFVSPLWFYSEVLKLTPTRTGRFGHSTRRSCIITSFD
jgi:hypothetical protein